MMNIVLRNNTVNLFIFCETINLFSKGLLFIDNTSAIHSNKMKFIYGEKMT